MGKNSGTEQKEGLKLKISSKIWQVLFIAAYRDKTIPCVSSLSPQQGKNDGNCDNQENWVEKQSSETVRENTTYVLIKSFLHSITPRSTEETAQNPHN